MQYDLVIVGAGQAGLTMATRVAQQGLRVVVLEKNDRRNLSHDEWDNVIESIFIRESPIPIDDDFTFVSSPHSFISPDLKTRVQTHPQASLREIAIDRRKYCQRLLENAFSNGVEVQDRTQVVNALFDKDFIIGVVVRRSSGEEERILGKIIVDASGPTGVLRRFLPPSFGIPRDLALGDVIYGYRAYFNLVGTPERGHLNLLGFGGKRSLAWVNTAGQYADILLTTFYADDVPNLPDFVFELRKQFPYIGTELKRGGHTAPIITRRMLDQIVGNGLMLVGDAGCTGYAITGSGILGSLISARIAANVATLAIKQGNVGKAALWPYAAQFVEERGAYFASAHYFALVLFSQEFSVINFAFKNQVVEARDLEASVTWTPLAIGAGEAVTKFLRAWPRVGTIVKFAMQLAEVPKVLDHWKTYPRQWDPATMAAWSRKNRDIFAQMEQHFQALLGNESTSD